MRGPEWLKPKIRQGAIIAAIAVSGLSASWLLGREGTRPGRSEDRVRFAIQQMSLQDGTRRWVATAGEGAAAVRFGIEFRVMEPAGGEQWAVMEKGAFYRQPGGDARPFLAELARAMGAPRVPTAGPRVDRLPFDIAIFGTRLSRGSGKNVLAGEFTTDPAGPWIVGKLFLADGEAEIFLALHPDEGYGEFLAKDPEYGEAVVRELARLF